MIQIIYKSIYIMLYIVVCNMYHIYYNTPLYMYVRERETEKERYRETERHLFRKV